MGKPGKKLKKIFLILGITGAVYGGFKYLLPLVVPFLCAYLAALWLGPSVRYFERRLTIRLGGKERRIPAAVIGGAELLFMGAVLGWLFYLGSSRLLAQARLFMVRLPEWLSEADRILTGLFLSLEEKMGLMPESLVGLARELVRDASEAVRQASLPLLMTNSVSVLAWAVRAVVFLVLFFVAAVMTLEEMDEIREKKSGSIFHREFSVLGRRIASAGSAWFKTQLVIMAVTAMICTLGLTLLGNPYSVLLGLGIGLLDALRDRSGAGPLGSLPSPGAPVVEGGGAPFYLRPLLFYPAVPGGKAHGKPHGPFGAGDPVLHVCGPGTVWRVRLFFRACGLAHH